MDPTPDIPPATRGPDAERPRLFVLGAGFSRPAGIPLGDELFPLIVGSVEARDGVDTRFHQDVRAYTQYRAKCYGDDLEAATINLEDFMAFLDLEHVLDLRGKDTWSVEGNEGQIIVRQAIGRVIQARTPTADSIPGIYYRFADQLTPADTVITLNYDILLERALEHVGKKYRLFHHRLQNVTGGTGVVATEDNDVLVLKLHGSVDWFDKQPFDEMSAGLRSKGLPIVPLDPVFDDPAQYGARPVIDGLHLPDDPLRHVFRISAVDEYYHHCRTLHAPFILAPSHVKFAYAEPIVSLWHGLYNAGYWDTSLAIIGYSLPTHDEYMRICLYRVLRNFQGSSWGRDAFGKRKDCARFVDLRTTDEAIRAYQDRYRFVDAERAKFYFGGFDESALDFLCARA